METTSILDQFDPGLLSLNSSIQIPTAPPQPKPASKFGAVMGRLAGIAGNILMPGLGGMFGNMLGGAPGGGGSDPTQYLRLQEQIQAESRKYETISAVLKAKHDAAMDAVRNISH
jgi:hypothetical protein